MVVLEVSKQYEQHVSSTMGTSNDTVVMIKQNCGEFELTQLDAVGELEQEEGQWHNHHSRRIQIDVGGPGEKSVSISSISKMEQSCFEFIISKQSCELEQGLIAFLFVLNKNEHLVRSAVK